MEAVNSSNNTPLAPGLIQKNISSKYQTLTPKGGSFFDKQSIILLVSGIFFIASLGFWIYINFFFK